MHATPLSAIALPGDAPAITRSSVDRPGRLTVTAEHKQLVARTDAGDLVACGAGPAELGEQLQAVAPAAPLALGLLCFDPITKRYLLRDPGGAVLAQGGYFDLLPQIAHLKPRVNAESRKRPVFLKKEKLAHVREVLNYGEGIATFIAVAIGREVDRRRRQDVQEVAHA